MTSGVHMDARYETKKLHHHDDRLSNFHDFALLKEEHEAEASQEQTFQIHSQMIQNYLKQIVIQYLCTCRTK